jgi:hypothetical protein
LIFDVYSSYIKQSMSSIAQKNRISKATKLPVEAVLPRSENKGEFPWKKSVRWSEDLVEVREYEKPFRKGSYGELSQRLGKPVRVLGKPVRVPVKVEEKRDSNCICT